MESHLDLCGLVHNRQRLRRFEALREAQDHLVEHHAPGAGCAEPAKSSSLDQAEVDDLVHLGLIERTGLRRLRATSAGRMVLNEVVLRLSQSFEPVEPLTIIHEAAEI